MKQVFHAITLVLALVLFVCFITSCNDPANSTTSGESGDKDSSPTSVSGNPPETTASQTTYEQPPDTWKATKTAGVYTLDNDISSQDSLQLTEENGVLMYAYIRSGMDTSSGTIKLRDMRKNTELGTLELAEGVWQLGRLSNGGFYVVDQAKDTVRLYDTACKLTKETTIPTKEFLSSCQVSSDGKLALYNTSNTPAKLYDFDSQKTISLSKELYINEIFGYDGKAFLFTALDNTLYRTDSSGNTVDVQARPSAHLVGPYIVETNREGYLVRTTLSPTISYFPADMEGDYPVAAADGFITSLTDKGIQIFNLHTNRSTKSLELGGNLINMCYTGEGTAVVLMQDNNQYHTYVLVLDKLEYPNTISLTLAGSSELEDNIFDKWTGDADTIAKAQHILDAYGVRIGFNCQEDLFWYECVPVSADKISERLTWVENYLKLLPQGLMQEVGKGKEVWLYLCNEIKNTDSEGGPAGFATELLGHPFIAIDVDGSENVFTETLAHECVHIFDYRMDSTWLSQWEAMSPADGYVMSYSQGIADRYVPYENSTGEVWFYDHYSRSYPAEDRAVIGQKLYQCYLDGKLTDEFQKNEHLREKAALFCRMMRASYTSCEKADTLYWEKYLNLN